MGEERTLGGDAAGAMRVRLQGDLRAAMKAREQRRVTLLRTLIAAIDNAEAVAAPVNESGPARLTGGSRYVATGPAGESEVPRRMLSAAEVDAVLAAEQAGRREAAAQMRGGGRPVEAEALEADAEAIGPYREP